MVYYVEYLLIIIIPGNKNTVVQQAVGIPCSVLYNMYDGKIRVISG